MTNEWTLHTCDRLEERYYEARHPVGLRVLVSPKDLSSAYAVVGVGYGSRDRFAGGSLPMGTAHFLEHKMFERADGSGWEDVFSALGAEVNAYTSDDCTAYMVSCTDGLTEALEALLRLVSEIHVSRRSVSRERSIIAEEIRMNADDPWEVCFAQMLRGLYAPTVKGGDPLREEICGSEVSIGRITEAVLCAAHSRYYRPENMVLAVSGRVTPEAVMEVVDRVYAPSAATKAPPFPLSSRRPRETNDVYAPAVSARMQTAKPLFCIGVKAPDVPTAPTALARRERLMTVLCEMLFSRSGDFYNRLFESGMVSPGMSYGSSVGRPAISQTAGSYGYYYVSGECDDPRVVYEEFLAYIRRIREEGMDKAAFDRARRTLYADFVYGFDSTEGIASSLMTSALDGVELYELLSMVETLTMDEVRALFERDFTESRFTLATVLPTEEETASL